MIICELCKGKIKKDKEIQVRQGSDLKYFCDLECLKIYCDEKLCGGEKL